MEDFREGGNEGCIGAVWHWAENECVKVINVCDKNVLHILKLLNRKRSGDIRVHGAGRGIGNGGKAKHVVHHTCFMDGKHVVNLSACLQNVWVVVASGGSAGMMASHMAFVGGGRLGQMGMNQIGHEAGDGFQLGTLGEGKQECGGCWGTQ